MTEIRILPCSTEKYIYGVICTRKKLLHGGNAGEQTTLASTRVLSRCAEKATAECCIKFKLQKTLLDCSPVSMEEDNLFWTLKYLVLAAIYSLWRTLWTFCAPLQLQLRSCMIIETDL